MKPSSISLNSCVWGVLLVLLLGFSPAVQAQKLMEKGSKALGFGMGLGYSYYGGYGVSTPWFVRAHLDIGVGNLGPTVFSIGPMIGFGQTSYRWRPNRNNELRWTWTNTVIAARLALHYDFEVPRLDTYAGFAPGIRIETFRSRWVSGKDPVYDDRNDWGGAYPAGAFFLGAAYGLTDQISLFGEFGFGYSWANIGLQIHF
jgi:hypothetical protein